MSHDARRFPAAGPRPAGQLSPGLRRTPPLPPSPAFPRGAPSTPGFGGVPAPTSALDPCAFPSNPLGAFASGEVTSGAPYYTYDPYFATADDRDAWIAAHPTCTKPPPWQAPVLVAPPAVVTPSTPATSTTSTTSGDASGLPPNFGLLVFQGVLVSAVSAFVIALIVQPAAQHVQKRVYRARHSTRRGSRRSS